MINTQFLYFKYELMGLDGGRWWGMRRPRDRRMKHGLFESQWMRREKLRRRTELSAAGAASKSCGRSRRDSQSLRRLFSTARYHFGRALSCGTVDWGFTIEIQTLFSPEFNHQYFTHNCAYVTSNCSWFKEHLPFRYFPVRNLSWISCFDGKCH